MFLRKKKNNKRNAFYVMKGRNRMSVCNKYILLFMIILFFPNHIMSQKKNFKKISEKKLHQSVDKKSIDKMQFVVGESKEQKTNIILTTDEEILF